MVDSESKSQFTSVVTNLDALIPTVLGLVGLKDAEGNAATSLEALINGFLTDDIADMLVGLITELLAGLPSETIDMILGYVTELTNLELDITPAAFANDDFGSKAKAFFEAAVKAYNEENADAEDFTAVTLETITWAQVWAATSSEVTVDGETTVEFDGYAWGITGLMDLINLVCDFIQPLDPILALILMGGQVEADFIASEGTTTGKSLSVLDEINIMGGMGYNYAIIPLLELLGIDAMSQEAYDEAVEANAGSVLYPILNQLASALLKDGGILDKPITWLTSILANLCYVLANDGITTIVDNLLAPVNMLIAKIDKLFPIAIDINIADIGNETAENKVVDLYLGTSRPSTIKSGIHVRVSGEAVSALLTDLLGGIELTINGQQIKLIKETGINLNWLELAAKAAAAGETNAEGKTFAATSSTKLDPKYDIYEGGAYSTIVGDPAETFATLLAVVLESVNVDVLIDALGLGDEIKNLITDLIKDPTGIIDAITELFSGTVSYQPVQNRPVDLSNPGIDYSTYLTFTDENADIIAGNLDQLIKDILNKAGLGSIEGLLSGFITDEMVNGLLDTIFGLLAGDSVAGILNTVKGLTFHVRSSTEEELTDANQLVIDLTPYGFAQTLETLELGGKHSYLKAFYDKVAAVGKDGTWAEVGSMADLDWGIDSAASFSDKLEAFAAAFAGVLTPLNGVLELLLMGEGKYLNVLGLIDIAGGNGYDYAIIPLLEAFGLTSTEVMTQVEYKTAVAEDKTQLLGYILDRVVYFASGLLDKPVDSLLSILPNLAYFFSNDGLLLTVKNLLAPVYDILNLVLPILGIKLEDYLALEKLLADIDLGIVIGGAKYGFKIPEIDWNDLVINGAEKAVEVSTSRSNPTNAPYNSTWANSYKVEMKASEYAAYANTNGTTDPALFKDTQKVIIADKGDTLTWIFTFLFDMFSTENNREALVQWIVEFFELQSGAEQTVRYAVNELFNQAQVYNSSDMVVSVLFYLLGMGVIIDASLMGNVKQIQAIFEDLFGAMGSNSGCTYASIAKIMEELTGVWDDTIGSDQDHEDAVEDAEETLNWFQRLIKKIKEFFQKIFSIFK